MMSPISRRRFAVILGLLGAGLTAGCASPTLPPLPPPSRPSLIMSAGQGEVLLEGSVPVAEARVLVLNTKTKLIFGELITSNRYSIVAQAQPGDRLQLSYSSSNHSSASVDFEVPDFDTPQTSSTDDAGGGVDAGK